MVNELLAAVLAYRVFSRLTRIISLGMREGGCRDRPDLSRQRKDVVKRSRPDQAEEINLGALLESERSTFDVLLVPPVVCAPPHSPHFPG
jgi:hypothetical protein